ncbi:hypothetical protein C8J56DRAFT_832969 [Mycena floridula]|nr:hypothetical protein C8J56DRAFT_832969 [Mycena floridula]
MSHTFSSSPYFVDRGYHGTAQPITERVNPHSRPIVSYYFARDVGFHHYGDLHPMKPIRLALTNALVMGYGLDKKIHKIYDVRPATQTELEMYHDHDYIEFLSRVSPRNQAQMKDMLISFNCGDDCPVFSEMWDFCKMYAGASLAAARKLCAQTTDIAINWSGGLHHAKRGEASGFCYVNDIVLAILELLRYHARVLYIDIDIHHGDGVEQAFYQSNRVMTLSIHKHVEGFFPGTGKLEDNGHALGKHFCINVPLKDGITDTMYVSMFKTITRKVIESFDPSCIVLQCGADSLGCDRLGAFSLSIAAHGECVAFVKGFNLPMLVLGGGGYTIKNVSRCWTYETSVLVGTTIPNELPATVYDSFFADSQYKLHPPISGKITNQNTPQSIERIIRSIDNKLRYLQGAPSVAMQEIPPDLLGLLADEDRDSEEQIEEQSTALAGEIRSDPHTSPLEYYQEDRDVEALEAASFPNPARRISSRATKGVAKQIFDPLEEPTKKRKQTATRGRGRPPGRGARASRGWRKGQSKAEVESQYSFDSDLE